MPLPVHLQPQSVPVFDVGPFFFHPCFFSSHWIYTMYRCVIAALVAAAPFVAQAQVQRNFPQNALRGDAVFTAPPTITLNGQPAQLAPGSRIRGQNNLLQLSGALAGQALTVNYTVDQYGLVMDVWVLRPEEIANRWPRTPDEASKLVFDPIAQTWTKP